MSWSISVVSRLTSKQLNHVTWSLTNLNHKWQRTNILPMFWFVTKLNHRWQRGNIAHKNKLFHKFDVLCMYQEPFTFLDPTKEHLRSWCCSMSTHVQFRFFNSGSWIQGWGPSTNYQYIPSWQLKKYPCKRKTL
jgi:hypothetical protein